MKSAFCILVCFLASIVAACGNHPNQNLEPRYEARLHQRHVIVSVHIPAGRRKSTTTTTTTSSSTTTTSSSSTTRSTTKSTTTSSTTTTSSSTRSTTSTTKSSTTSSSSTTKSTSSTTSSSSSTKSTTSSTKSSSSTTTSSTAKSSTTTTSSSSTTKSTTTTTSTTSTTKSTTSTTSSSSTTKSTTSNAGFAVDPNSVKTTSTTTTKSSSSTTSSTSSTARTTSSSSSSTRSSSSTTTSSSTTRSTSSTTSSSTTLKSSSTTTSSSSTTKSTTTTTSTSTTTKSTSSSTTSSMTSTSSSTTKSTSSTTSTSTSTKNTSSSSSSYSVLVGPNFATTTTSTTTKSSSSATTSTTTISSTKTTSTSTISTSNTYNSSTSTSTSSISSTSHYVYYGNTTTSASASSSTNEVDAVDATTSAFTTTSCSTSTYTVTLEYNLNNSTSTSPMTTTQSATYISSTTSSLNNTTTSSTTSSLNNITTSSTPSYLTTTTSSFYSNITTSTTYAYTNVTSSTTTALNTTTTTSMAPSSTGTVRSTVLVIARDEDSANDATYGLNAYGIPFETLLVPQSGATLPTLNTTKGGKYGGIVVLSGLAYNYGGSTGWQSALTTDQWNTLYAYQTSYHVRMVQWDVYPQAAFDTTVVGSCCDNGVEQLISFTNTNAFSQAGLRTGAGMSTLGLYHYGTQITDTTTTTEIASFAANSEIGSDTTAAVINNFNGREQMVFFMTWAADWSTTSNFLQHAWITWITRGVYAGYRRTYLNTQIDDMMLRTQIYYPGASTNTYRSTVADLQTIQAWVPTIQAKMNPGSWYKPEIGHNGNGNLLYINSSYYAQCSGGPVYPHWTATALEFVKPLGTGTDGWPTTPAAYPYSDACLQNDPLAVWMSQPSNRDSFLHISHTFSHEGEDNATYSDIDKEISWNQIWLNQTGIANGDFTSNGIIPPAITGLHNGDALRAWWDNGITNCVGDNSRPLLVNQDNLMWPYITTSANDGFDGMLVIPRWPLRIYYDCDTPACTYQEWVDQHSGSGGFSALMAAELSDEMFRLFGLRHDGVMFHQLNLRNVGMDPITTPYGTTVNSLFQAWNEQTVHEFTRLVNWPLITMKQSDMAVSFTNRMTRDGCGYGMSWNQDNSTITGVTVYSTSGGCSVPVPLTVPGSVTDTQGFRTEQIGSDPLTIWVQLSGSPITFTLTTPVLL